MASLQCCALLAVMVAVALVQPAFSRSLQQNALSNSNGCLDTIPKCEAGACATRNVMGVARWVCLRCLANYDPVVTADGQDNIIQCVCPKGTFENGTTATSCTRCPTNVFCPGGDRVENPANRGNPITCGTGLVTRNTGARSASDCVAPAGYAMTSPTSATACLASSYAPAYNRLGKCLRCQSGLEENPAQNLTDGGRWSKRTVCKVPPGRFMSQGLVRICPQGFYRENYTDFDAAVAQKCIACNPGITTNGAGAKSPAECNRVLPGYGISIVYNVSTNASAIPALPVNPGGLPAAPVCGIGFYSSGGYCAQCPWGTVTRVNGSKAIEECVVPPGYYLPAAGMTSCGSGFFRQGWLMYIDPKATVCTPCGDGILSEARDLDEHPLVANGSVTRATSTSCYIEAGQGMIASGKNAFSGKDCPANTYGVAGRVYGWQAAPCKPCARNLITDGATKVNSSEVCVNDDGFGYASEGASRCAPGFYSAKGSRKPCQQCLPGRTTDDLQAKQTNITNCYVKPGFGVVNSTSNATDAYNPDTTGWTDTQLLNLPVLECPIGYFSGGNTTGAECTACPAGSSTQATASTSVADCNVCVAGYGKGTRTVSTSNTCDLCAYGSHQGGGLAQCELCPTTTFYPPVDGVGLTYTSDGTTLYRGAFSSEACVPKKHQMSPEAGQAYFTTATNVTLATSSASNFAACVEACPADKCCLAQFDGTCKQALLTPESSASTGFQLVYKLPPSDLVGASSLTKAKMMSSGFYAHCSIPATDFAKWFSVGSSLGALGRTFFNGTAPAEKATSKAVCKSRCDNSNVCIGFIVTTSSTGAVTCYYRGGVDALNSRSLFALPVPSSTLDLNSFNW